jgi:uncharacterized protein YndB with AHSA1/START domain
MKIAAVIVLILVVAAGAVLAYAATRPDTFRVERSAEIKAPPERVFALIDDLRGWTAWSPYEKKDPAMKRSHSGASRGKGAVYEWDGDKNVGQGRMEIVDTAPPNRVTIKLDFMRPFEAHNTAEFVVQPAGDGSRVTWAIFGPMPLVSKVICLFMDMDRMIGKDFEEGLASLKALAEKPAG